MPRPLNTELGGTGRNDGQINYVSSLPGTSSRPSNEKLGDIISLMDFTGADNTGTAEQDAVFAAAVSAISSRGGTILIPRGSYKLTTSTFTLVAKQNITFQGVGGLSNNDTPGTVITLYNTGSGDIIDMRSAIGCAWNDVFFNVLQAHTGNLLKIGNNGTNGDAAYNAVRRCGFSNGGNHTVTYIDLDKSICTEISGNYFTQGRRAMRGQDGAGGSYANVVAVKKNFFIGSNEDPIQYGGEAWEVSENTFEPKNGGAAGAFGAAAAAPSLGITFSKNWTGDVTTAGGTWITVAGSGLTIVGNEFGGTSGSNAVSLIGVTGAKINGNNFNTFATAIDFSSGTNEDIDPSGNNYTSVTTKFGTTANFGGYAAAGYMYQGALIKQWGTTSVTTGVQGTATFSKTFGTGGPWTISAQVVNPPAAGNVVVCSTVTTSSMKLDCTGTAGGQTVYWEVMGPRS